LAAKGYVKVTAPSTAAVGQTVDVSIEWGNVGDETAHFKLTVDTTTLRERDFDPLNAEITGYTFVQKEGGTTLTFRAQREVSPGLWATDDEKTVTVATPGAPTPGPIDWLTANWLPIALVGALASVLIVGGVVAYQHFSKK
jgi:predicted secreted protein